MNEQEEIKFFTSVMKDHAVMHLNTLAFNEKHYLDKAQEFFNKYNQYINSNYNKQELLKTTIEFINYKKNMLNNILDCKLKINLPPSFINHQINEAKDFVDTLQSDSCNPVNNNPGYYIKKWISDAIGHIDSLISMLDPSETLIIDKLKIQKHIFNSLLKKSSELEDISNKIGIKTNFMVLCQEVIMHLEELIIIFDEIGKKLNNCQLECMGVLSSMITNHFIKEHQHVIRTLKHCIN